MAHVDREGAQVSQKKKFIGLTGWIFIALLAGIVVGVACNYLVPDGSSFDEIAIEGLFYLIGQGFIRLMQMLVVPLVFCSIVCGAASIGNGKTLGKVGGVTILLYLLTTAVAVLMALGIANIINPGLGLDMSSIQMQEATTAEPTSIIDTLLNIIPSNVFASFADGSMLPIIFFALIVGLIIGQMGEQVQVVKRFFDQFSAIMMKMVELVLRVAPIGVFA